MSWANRLIRNMSCLMVVFTICAAAQAFAQAGPEASSSRVVIPTLAASALGSAVDLGAASGTQKMSLVLTLKPTSDRVAALDQFLESAITPGSASYHQWLMPAQFGTTYGASSDQIAAATAWAQSQGLTVEGVSPGQLRMTVSGSGATVESALSVSLHQYRMGNALYVANATQPSLPADTAAVISAISGLSNLPASAAMTATSLTAKRVNATTAVTLSTLADTVDANLGPIVTLDSTVCTAALSSSEIAAYTSLFRQAAAQGISVLSSRSCTTGAFPAELPEVTAVSLPGEQADTSSPTVARPDWQLAPGLPEDTLRHTPDVTASSLAAFADTITAIVSKAGVRQGNINRVLYSLGPVPGLYTQPDHAAAGTWEAATGLGLVNLDLLAKAFAAGTGSSFTSIMSNNYAPTHGTSFMLTSNVTSGTGGAAPTGTVTFSTTSGILLAIVPLANGTATYTTAALDGGNISITAVYSGDSTYASSSSNTTTIAVQPEQSVLTVAFSSGAIVGAPFDVFVTDASASGVGLPSGTITVTFRNSDGTSTPYTGTLAPISLHSSATTISIPTNTVGTLSFDVVCGPTPSFSCGATSTETIAIGKATPTLTISYTPNPPVAGQTTFSATVSAVGTAPTPTGNVNFLDNGTEIIGATLADGSTTTTGQVPNTTTHLITAKYDGDPTYNSVTTTVGYLTSGAIATTTSLSSSATSISSGGSLVLTATITDPKNTLSTLPTGSVAFYDGTALLGTVAVVDDQTTTTATATFTATAINSVGSHSLSAIYTGDSNYASSKSSALAVTIATTATLTAKLSDSTVLPGSSTTLTATLTAASGQPTGSIAAILNGNTNSGTIPTTTSSVAIVNILLTAPAAAGTYPITVSCVSSVVTCTPATISLTVSDTALIGTSTALTAGSTTPTSGAADLLTATITAQSAGAAAPSGTVVFYDGANQLATSAVNNSVATANVALTGALTHSLTAVYSGDTLYAPSTSAVLSATDQIAPVAITLASNTTSAFAGQTVTFTATVAGATSAGAVPTGTVSFYLSGGTLLGTAPLAGGVASYAAQSLADGNETVYAVYSGDSNFATVTSSNIAVTLGDYSVALASSSLSLNSGATGQVTATLTMGFPGTVAFSCVPPSGVSITCTFNPASLTANGTTTLTVTAGASSARLTSPAVFTQRRLLAGGFSLAAVCFFLPLRRRRRRISLLAAFLLLSAGLNVGCGGGNTSGPSSASTPQTSTLTIHTLGTEGTNTVAHDYTVQLTVQ
jgi:trimeric autotransporter adhesin